MLPNWDDTPFFNTAGEAIRGGIWGIEKGGECGGDGAAASAADKESEDDADSAVRPAEGVETTDAESAGVISDDTGVGEEGSTISKARTVNLPTGRRPSGQSSLSVQSSGSSSQTTTTAAAKIKTAIGNSQLFKRFQQFAKRPDGHTGPNGRLPSGGSSSMSVAKGQDDVDAGAGAGDGDSVRTSGSTPPPLPARRSSVASVKTMPAEVSEFSRAGSSSVSSGSSLGSPIAGVLPGTASSGSSSTPRRDP